MSVVTEALSFSKKVVHDYLYITECINRYKIGINFVKLSFISDIFCLKFYKLFKLIVLSQV